MSVSIAPQGFESGGHFINFPYVWLSPGPPSSELAPFCGKWQSLDTILSRVCSVTCVCFSTVSVPAVPHWEGLGLLLTFCPEELGSLEKLCVCWGAGHG